MTGINNREQEIQNPLAYNLVPIGKDPLESPSHHPNHSSKIQMTVDQNQWYHFGVGAPPIFVYFSGDRDVHWGYDLDFDPWPSPTNANPIQLGLCNACLQGFLKRLARPWSRNPGNWKLQFGSSTGVQRQAKPLNEWKPYPAFGVASPSPGWTSKILLLMQTLVPLVT